MLIQLFLWLYALARFTDFDIVLTSIRLSLAVVWQDFVVDGS